MKSTATIIFVVVMVATFGGPRPAFPRTPERVLLVVNTRSSASAEIGEYYRSKRKIAHVVKISVTEDEEIPRDVFESEIKEPLIAYLKRNRIEDQILYIVTTKGVPLKIKGTGGVLGDRASVDSELTLLYREMAYGPAKRDGRIKNPFFGAGLEFKGVTPFDHDRYDIYLVTRLTGFTTADVMALTDRSLDARREGTVLLDMEGDSLKQGNNWLWETARLLQGMGAPAVLEASGAFLESFRDLIGYASWGTNDLGSRARHPGHRWVAGALAVTFVSTDARTFQEPPPEWKPGPWKSKEKFYAGSPQGLVGDLIRSGVTGVAGSVYEPYLDSMVRPFILFPVYLAGYNLSESFYMAMPFLSWQTVVVGDPLTTIGKGPAISRPLVRFIDLRRKLYERALTLPNDLGSRLFLGSVYESLGDIPGAEQELQQAAALDLRNDRAQLALAALYERHGEPTKAESAYLNALQANPDSVIALNNLAWSYAARGEKLEEALRLAQRAVALAPRDPNIGDTLGWVYYRRGEYQKAVGEYLKALQLSPEQPVILYHLGEAQLRLGEFHAARGNLSRALELSSLFPGAERAEALLKGGGLNRPGKKGLLERITEFFRGITPSITIKK